MTWTFEDERKCLQKIRQGKTYQQIADELGRSRKAVVYFVSKKRKAEPGVWKRIADTRKRSDQPCWVCFYGSGAAKDGWKCPWADHLEAVPGWDAELVPYYVHNTASGVRYDWIWRINSCPRYEEG